MEFTDPAVEAWLVQHEARQAPGGAWIPRSPTGARDRPPSARLRSVGTQPVASPDGRTTPPPRVHPPRI